MTEQPESNPASERYVRRDRPPTRRNGIPVVVALLFAVVALVGGLFVGYSVRGEPAPAGLITEQRDVPVVTVTVEAP
jgi:hypothetical protein